MSAQGWTDWRDTMAEPCTCSPGDGIDVCPREAECYDAWCAFYLTDTTGGEAEDE